MDTFDKENEKLQSKETIDWLSIRLKPTFDLIEKRLEHRKKGAKNLFSSKPLSKVIKYNK